MSKTFDFKNYKNVTVSISLINSETIQELNKKYLDKNYPTDVLSFNIDEEIDEETYYLGDIAINVEQAFKQAREYGNDLEHEIAELTEHGMLHLLDVHHEGDDWDRGNREDSLKQEGTE